MFHKIINATVDRQLDTIEARPVRRVAELAELMPPGEYGAGVAFFEGATGDRTLQESLHIAGWQIIWEEDDYFYTMRHHLTREVLTYISGDIYEGHRPPA